MTAQAKPDYSHLPDIELAGLVAKRDPAAVKLVTQRNNQRLFRAAWSILKNRAEAEDAVQSAYLHAFAAIGDFAGRSQLSTWLTRIVVNEALGRDRAARRRRARLDPNSVVHLADYREAFMRGSMTAATPDNALARAEIRRMIEAAVERLPAQFRVVFVLREIESLSVEETAETLGVLPATVKTRLLRARRRLQDDLGPELRTVLDGAFPFAGADCDAMTARVIAAYCGKEAG
ncbi:MAG TPA: RNA polymerase sigma factor [Allosphingosinicella sp.]